MLISQHAPSVAAPQISVVVVMHNMHREARRTLHTLTRDYQTNMAGVAYEVLVVDSNSAPPLDSDWVCSHGPEFGHLVVRSDTPTPTLAMNTGVSRSRGQIVACAIDGARMLSPGCIGMMARCHELFEHAFVFTPGYHLGQEPQSKAVLNGYDQRVEDEMLASITWQRNGYQLFDHAVLAGSCDDGLFRPYGESNFFSLPRGAYAKLNGLDEEFISPGGGYVNLDFYQRAMSAPDLVPINLVNEGSFHQFHGGVSTNIPASNQRHQLFRDEYRRLRGQRFARPQRRPILFHSA